jgi:integrase
MSGHLDDRWFKEVKNPDGSTKKVKTARHGTGRRWRVRYIDPGETERSRSFDLKDDAETYLTQVKASLLNDTYLDPALGKVTLRRYATQWLENQSFAATTRERVDQRLRNHILPKLGDKTLTQLAKSPSTIQAWVRGLKAPDGTSLAPGSVRAILANLSSIFTAAVDDGVVGRNPCRLKSVKGPKVTKTKVIPWTAAEVRAARAALPERYRVLADLGAREGLRQGEAFAFSPRDVDWLKRVIHVRRQVVIVNSKLCFKSPKGEKERDVPLTDEMARRINEHTAAFPAVDVTLPWANPDGKLVTVPLLVTTAAKHALDRAYFHRLWRGGVLAAAGKPPERQNGFHALRHFFASAELAGGTDIKTLSAHLGHEDPGFTLRVYTHLMTSAADKTRKVIDDALAEPSDGPQTAQASRD